MMTFHDGTLLYFCTVALSQVPLDRAQRETWLRGRGERNHGEDTAGTRLTVDLRVTLSMDVYLVAMCKECQSKAERGRP